VWSSVLNLFNMILCGFICLIIFWIVGFYIFTSIFNILCNDMSFAGNVVCMFLHVIPLELCGFFARYWFWNIFDCCILCSFLKGISQESRSSSLTALTHCSRAYLVQVLENQMLKWLQWISQQVDSSYWLANLLVAFFFGSKFGSTISKVFLVERKVWN